MEKKIRKGKSKLLCGVCSGIAEYFDWDATWVRLGVVAASLCYGAGIILYLAAAWLFPPAEETKDAE